MFLHAQVVKCLKVVLNKKPLEKADHCVFSCSPKQMWYLNLFVGFAEVCLCVPGKISPSSSLGCGVDVEIPFSIPGMCSSASAWRT